MACKTSTKSVKAKRVAGVPFITASRFHVVGTPCHEKFASILREKVTTSLLIMISSKFLSI